MNAKEWLMRAWKIDREINALLKAKETAFDRLTGSGAARGSDPVSDTKDPHRAFDSYIQLSDSLDRRIEDLYTMKAEIMEVINCVKNNTQRVLLINRYVLFKTWEQIAVDMNYSYQGVLKIHSAALLSVNKLLEPK